MTEKKKTLLKEIKEIDDRMLDFYKRNPTIHPERLTFHELNKLRDAFITIDTLFRLSAIRPDPDFKEKFKVGDYVIPTRGCNKGIPCKVISTYFTKWNDKPEQYITVIPLRKSDVLKGHTASRTKENKYTASNKIFKFIIRIKDGKTGKIKPGLYDCVNNEYVPILDEDGNPMKGDEDE